MKYHFGWHSAAWAMIVMLTGCQTSENDIDSFIAQVENQSRKEIAQLEPEKTFQASQFNAHELRGPFMLPAIAVANQPKIKQDCWQPRLRTKTGALELYPLEQLSLRGVMASKGDISGLVQTPKGTLVSVTAGEYLGLNNGKVTKVTPQFILIKETLPDGLGCWQQRSVKLALK
ncbi:pilus assembly protein PilP [Vibrio aphrogenes]|uniref:pilus assembly protein PilP n=1 Tax=Vibrio aphrogenes TaxID=1891186 RepID=UPI000B352B99|nr:pilus assembly protein PilP [Vibrio aphrogenes]